MVHGGDTQAELSRFAEFEHLKIRVQSKAARLHKEVSIPERRKQCKERVSQYQQRLP
jgi:hypothetical protein